MKKNEIFVTDLDGTFVKDSRVVANLDRASLLSLKKEMPIAIATGRSVKEIQFIEEQIGVVSDIQIGFNGGVIKMGDRTIFECPIDKLVLKKILSFIERKKVIFDALDGDKRIGTHKTDDVAKLWNMELVQPLRLFQTIQEKKIYKINIRPEIGETDVLLNELQEIFPQLAICKSGEKRIEITPQNVTKGHALELLKEEYNLDFISAGDSENDISMFKESRQSFCMSHATEAVKKEATNIIENFHEVMNLIS